MATLNQGLTLLNICEEAAGRMGLPLPTAIIGNSEKTAVRFLRIAHKSGLALVRQHDWQALSIEKTFTTVAAETQTDTPLPTDFDHMVAGTAYNRSKKRRLKGPLRAREWNAHKALTSQPLIDAFRIRGNLFLYYPAPAAGDTVAYEYVSNLWIDTDQDDAGEAVQFAADDDVVLIDEEVLIQDMIWRYRKSTGQAYAEDMRDAQLTALERIGRDASSRDVIGMGDNRPIGPGVVIPEGSWNQ